jgi:tRNA threonylcarbamoyladenosine biosynthesis protein TsaB
MYFLSFETSTKTFSLAINKDEKVLRYRNLKAALVLEDSILPTVDKILVSAGIKFSQIDGFAIALGPGSFTSLRVGLSTVKAFAMSTAKPVVGIPTLDIIAHGVDLGVCDEICVINDARRGKVYACLYGPKGRSSSPTLSVNRTLPVVRKSDFLLISLDDVLAKVHGKTIFVGDAIGLYRKDIEEAYQQYNGKKNSICKCLFADEKWWYPQSKVMAALAYERFRNKQYDDAASLLPLYLYPQDCQVSASAAHSEAGKLGKDGR